GTPLTMSPEQVRGQPVDNRADLWAVGVILYEMLTGRAPFSGDIATIGLRILNEEPRPPSALRPEVAQELDHIVMKLLRKERSMRYARAEDLLADLACVGGGGNVAAASGGTAPRIAVTYFEVLSDERSDLYLAAGLTDDLIVDLTRVEGVMVASREEV